MSFGGVIVGDDSSYYRHTIIDSLSLAVASGAAGNLLSYGGLSNHPKTDTPE